MQKHKILLVEDDRDIATTFKQGLEQYEFEVDTFSNPRLALSEFKVDWYNLLLLDINMPEMTGFELYRRLQKLDEKPKVCFITAFEIYHDEFRRVFPSLDVRCFIRKPISIVDLVKQLRLELEPAMQSS